MGQVGGLFLTVAQDSKHMATTPRAIRLAAFRVSSPRLARAVKTVSAHASKVFATSALAIRRTTRAASSTSRWCSARAKAHAEKARATDALAARARNFFI